MESHASEGESPVHCLGRLFVRYVLKESSCLGLQLKVGGKFLLKLNIGKRPIVKKYREGTMKRTLKRGLKLPEIVKREEFAISVPILESFLCFTKLWLLFRIFGNLCGFDLSETSKREVIALRLCYTLLCTSLNWIEVHCYALATIYGSVTTWHR